MGRCTRALGGSGSFRGDGLRRACNLYQMSVGVAGEGTDLPAPRRLSRRTQKLHAALQERCHDGTAVGYLQDNLTRSHRLIAIRRDQPDRAVRRRVAGNGEVELTGADAHQGIGVPTHLNFPAELLHPELQRRVEVDYRQQRRDTGRWIRKDRLVRGHRDILPQCAPSRQHQARSSVRGENAPIEVYHRVDRAAEHAVVVVERRNDGISDAWSPPDRTPSSTGLATSRPCSHSRIPLRELIKASQALRARPNRRRKRFGLRDRRLPARQHPDYLGL